MSMIVSGLSLPLVTRGDGSNAQAVTGKCNHPSAPVTKCIHQTQARWDDRDRGCVIHTALSLPPPPLWLLATGKVAGNLAAAEGNSMKNRA